MSSGDPTGGDWHDPFDGPDHVLASDDIRGVVDDILSTGDQDDRPLEALITAGERVISLELQSLQRTPTGVTVCGSCPVPVARPLLGLEASEWSDIEIFHGSETLCLIPLLGRQLDISFDLSAPGTCLITIVSRPQERKKQKQVL
jgi:hypothetical protein